MSIISDGIKKNYGDLETEIGNEKFEEMDEK